MSYASVASHRSMASDAVRNAAYAQAIKEAVGPESVVLDLGAGTGILGLMAARFGAKRVYLVEPEDIVALAEENVKANGLEDRVRCIHGRIEDVQLPERVDVIVSVLTGNFLLTEDLLGTLVHARTTTLKPGGVLIPSEAAMEAVPVSAPAVHDKEIASWSRGHEGIDLSPARAYAANTVHYRVDGLRDAAYLAEPATIHSLNFYEDDYSSLRAEASFEITDSGECHGVVGWFRMKLGERWLSTSPRADAMHWSPAFLPLDPPIALEKGEPVCLTLHRAPFGDWTWTVKTRSVTQRHSTLLSTPLKAATLQKAALDYRPSLNADGRAVAYVLSRCDGRTTMETIAQGLCERFPDRYHGAAEALRFAQGIVKSHA